MDGWSSSNAVLLLRFGMGLDSTVGRVDKRSLSESFLPRSDGSSLEDCKHGELGDDDATEEDNVTAEQMDSLALLLSSNEEFGIGEVEISILLGIASLEHINVILTLI